MSPPRMRTLPKAAAMLREIDPDTAFTLTALRRMVKRGEIVAVEVASRRLVNYDALLEHLAGQGVPTPQVEMSAAGTIRRVDL